MKRVVLMLIRGYRKYISPARPPCCGFIPTCSTYALEAVEVHGALKGSLLAPLKGHLKKSMQRLGFHRGSL